MKYCLMKFKLNINSMVEYFIKLDYKKIIKN